MSEGRGPNHKPPDVVTRRERAPAPAFSAHHDSYMDPRIGKELKISDNDPAAVCWIHEPIGKGGMGQVYIAYDKRDTTIKLAVKFLLKLENKNSEQETEMKERFLREARMLSAVRHANVVELKYAGYYDGELYQVMEFVEGRDLSQVLRATHRMQKDEKGGQKDSWLPVSWEKIGKPIIIQACEAVEAVHNKGIMHRDLKPANIFITSKGGKPFIKVGDFGLAKFTKEAEESDLTATGLVPGTPSYLAPEQAMGSNYDHRVDIYSLGVIIYEMLCGTVPFKGKTPAETLYLHINNKPIPPSQRSKGKSLPELDAIVMKALEKDPAKRFQSMEEFKQAIITGRIESKPSSKSNSGFGSGQLRELLSEERVPVIPHESISDVKSAEYSFAENDIDFSDVRQERPEKKKGMKGKLLLAVALIAGAAIGTYKLNPNVKRTVDKYIAKAEIERRIEDAKYDWQEFWKSVEERFEKTAEQPEPAQKSEQRPALDNDQPYAVTINTTRKGSQTPVYIDDARLYLERKIGGRIVRTKMGTVSRSRTITLPPGNQTLIMKAEGYEVKMNVTPENKTITFQFGK